MRPRLCIRDLFFPVPSLHRLESLHSCYSSYRADTARSGCIGWHGNPAQIAGAETLTTLLLTHTHTHYVALHSLGYCVSVDQHRAGLRNPYSFRPLSMDTSINPLPHTHMKSILTSKYALGFYAVIALMVTAKFLFLTSSASAQKAYPEQVTQLGQWIEQNSTAYNSASADLAKAAAAEKKAQDAMVQASGAADGYRKSLCNQFHLAYAGGKFTEQTDCSSFQ